MSPGAELVGGACDAKPMLLGPADGLEVAPCCCPEEWFGCAAEGAGGWVCLT